MANITIKILVIFSLMAVVFSGQENSSSSRLIEVKGGPNSVIWVVQLSDLHFSVHHPDRALDFKKLVSPYLSVINPSLVLITGDLTDGKSKDHSNMKQNEKEWVEYRDVMADVVKKSGLDKSIFYDLRGNHDNFGVPSVGGTFDFFSNYSLNAEAGRTGHVNSVTLQTEDRRHLFVGIDITMAVGLRGPTNLFGHPTDNLLAELDSELSKWGADPKNPVVKISFGHFPLSFSATSESGRTLKNVFLKHSISAYLCGHLHTRFGKNLKRLHRPSNDLMQLNMQQTSSKNSSNGSSKVQEFWEWEMGDWRRNRAMRILAIDRGHASFVDINLKSGTKKTIILPTFPLDSRFTLASSQFTEFEHQSLDPSHYMTIRALVFSSSPIISVVARAYDSELGNLVLVLEESMTEIKDSSSRGALYAAPWNFKAFQDPSPERYWLQIEAIDVRGRSTLTELRPFSINGLSSPLSWTWKEFMVMGCQWAALYLPILWLSVGCSFFILLLPVALLILFKKQYTLQNFYTDKKFKNGVGWVLTELYKLRSVWLGFLGYLFYLVLCPWFSGQLFTDGGERGYMTYRGWVVKHPEMGKKLEFLGFPDIMVIVIPHLVFVVFPSILMAVGLAMESEIYRIHLLALSGKKEDDHCKDSLKSRHSNTQNHRSSKFYIGTLLIRRVSMVACLAIFYKHFKSCKLLAKAYEMNPLLHFPVYSLSIPLLLAYAVYKTSRR
ncbi:putative metallophosphoesterase At3g03305 [Chenopodium quinoa]|uniref:Calcineurin-like phosphoesterase domain-containing protein n=1 Tax=Chenopodium quinoa TaxID=63459 RepID=A0A803MSH9_CHEQI|nr:putative metallophosphoesterase At3g03305 [Chenopodium quinoa]